MINTVVKTGSRFPAKSGGGEGNNQNSYLKTHYGYLCSKETNTHNFLWC